MRLLRAMGAVLAGGMAVAPLAACTSSGPGAAPAPTVTPTPKPEPTHPFTGRPGDKRGRVLAVKIENTKSGRPQLGVAKADLVYVEQVEGGVTRLMAVYSSTLPKKVGPVRSARISDLHLLPQFGRPALSYSGVQTKMKPYVAEAPVHDVEHGKVPRAYVRQPGRVAPYNLMAYPKRLLAAAPKASRAKDIGLTFSKEPPEGGEPAKRAKAAYPNARFVFKWSEKQGRWLIWQDGKKDISAEGPQLGAENVIIQYAKTKRSKFHDVNDNYTPLIKTTGSGRAKVLRDGRSYDAEWSRPKERKGTEFTDAKGNPIPLKPGRTWIVIVNDGKPTIP